jgi:hypothetical protein
MPDPAATSGCLGLAAVAVVPVVPVLVVPVLVVPVLVVVVAVPVPVAVVVVVVVVVVAAALPPSSPAFVTKNVIARMRMPTIAMIAGRGRFMR